MFALASSQAQLPVLDDLPRKAPLGAQLNWSSTQGTGIEIVEPLPGGTASTGLKKGDLLLELGGKSAKTQQELGAILATLYGGTKLKAKVKRDGKEIEVELTAQPRALDKGDNYDVFYHSVVSNGKRMRTLVSKPKGFEGKRPVMMLIQGLGPASIDQPLNGPDLYSKILKPFSDEGWVTLRVDKPGLGDSQGGPYQDNDFETELDIYRQAVKKIKTYDFVDADKIFIFGHSMGGAFGPVVAAEEQIRGLAVYGTTGRTWDEYFLENIRRQNKLGGANDEDNEENLRQITRIQHYLFREGKDYEWIAKEHPDLVNTLNDYMPDKKNIYTNTPRFWSQLTNRNFAKSWRAFKGNVLAIWGENEFITGPTDNSIIPEIVNTVNPGKAEYVALPGTDHAFKKTTSMQDSFQRWGQPGGEFNPNIVDCLKTWTKKILGS